METNTEMAENTALCDNKKAEETERKDETKFTLQLAFPGRLEVAVNRFSNDIEENRRFFKKPVMVKLFHDGQKHGVAYFYFYEGRVQLKLKRYKNNGEFHIFEDHQQNKYIFSEDQTLGEDAVLNTMRFAEWKKQREQMEKYKWFAG